MNTTRRSGPWRARSQRAIAIIGETTGASRSTSAGWKRSMNEVIAGHVVAM